MKITKIFTLMIAIGLLSGSYLSAGEAKNETKSVKKAEVKSEAKKETKKEELPTFKLKDVNGKVYDIKAVKWGLTFPKLKNKLVFIDMFGKNCPPCLKEIPHLVNLKKKYKDHIEIIALQVQEGMDIKETKEFIKEHKINYPVIKGRDFMQFIYYFAKKSGWKGMVPYMIMFSPEGKVKLAHKGFIEEAELEKKIKEEIKALKSAKKKK